MIQVRPYRHHIQVRLTYFEAAVLAQFIEDPETYFDPYETGALNRARAKIKEAGKLDRPRAFWEKPEPWEKRIKLEAS